MLNPLIGKRVATYDGHNTEYCDKSQTNIKDEFLETLYDLIKAGLVVKE